MVFAVMMLRHKIKWQGEVKVLEWTYFGLLYPPWTDRFVEGDLVSGSSPCSV